MARTNKYASINFNNVYDKNITNNKNNNNPSKQSSSSASYSTLGSSHGRMLVLTRPTPKPASITASVVSTPPLSPSPQNSNTQLPITQNQPRTDSEFDSISLRPSGRTGSGSCAVQIPELKPNKFVPPHLRPGFVKREERNGSKEVGQRQQQGYVGVGSGSGSPDGYGDNGRPKSGGGYERMRRGGESGLDSGNRPRSSGNRPNSSG